MMHLQKLSIAGESAVQGTFTHTAKMLGDALVYVVVRDPKQPPTWGTVMLPDAGDDGPPDVECQWPVLAGYTSKGRPVLVFRSGEQGPNGWTGKSLLYAGLGAASALREPGQSIVVQTTQPGPAGPKGDPGVMGPRGMAGPQGPAGKDGAGVTEDQMTRLANMTAERVYSLPPADWAATLPEDARSGSRFQDYITVMLLHQGRWQHILRAIGEAARNLLKAGVRF